MLRYILLYTTIYFCMLSLCAPYVQIYIWLLFALCPFVVADTFSLCMKVPFMQSVTLTGAVESLDPWDLDSWGKAQKRYTMPYYWCKSNLRWKGIFILCCWFTGIFSGELWKICTMNEQFCSSFLYLSSSMVNQSELTEPLVIELLNLLCCTWKAGKSVKHKVKLLCCVLLLELKFKALVWSA
jgi:hypothetical protein